MSVSVKEKAMKKVFYAVALLIPAVLLVVSLGWDVQHFQGAKAATCQTTAFSQDSVPNLTATMVVTANNTTITGPVNGHGCDIAVYINPGLTGITINSAQVFGSTFDGIVNDGSVVNVSNSQIHDIGDNPLDGVQYGDGIYYTATHTSKGKISNDLIWNYQKNGIVVRGVGSNVTITHNTVLGQGPVSFIAQNGIEMGEGAKGSITNNIVYGNSYTGSGNAASGGVLIYGGSCFGAALTIGVKVTGNDLIGNDVGVFLSNVDGTTCIPTLTPTNIVVTKNIITYDEIENTTGFSPTAGYQAGISDQGDNDTMNTNSICGLGYTPATTPPPYLYFIDVTTTNSPNVGVNTSCLDGSTLSLLAMSNHSGAKHVRTHLKASI
jgi:Right handed beta helix region